MDPSLLCRLASSCEEARQIDDTHYVGIVRVKVAIVSFRVRLEGEVLQRDEARYLEVALGGETLGLRGSLRGNGSVTFNEVEGGTEARYTANLHLLGRLGSLGQPLVQVAAQRLARTFATKVSTYLNGGE